jgi:TolB-like protein/tetratricopeptide (TPR) repeat protein
MQGESARPPGAPTTGVFLSYASQDEEAARRICEALRASGIQVWFDLSELRGGDAWDRQIRQRIHDCALFVPIISQQAHDRLEGYFRREWRLAIERAGDMAENRAFLVPVVIDRTTERDPSVPERFRELQWTRLPGGETPPAFVERIHRLLTGEPSSSTPAPGASATAAAGGGRPPASRGWRHILPAAAAAVVLVAVGFLATRKPWIPRPASPAAPVASTGFAPPPHSVAVLPFVNMSGDKAQEYFSDGLSEELLNSLSRLGELQVAARTSSFYFKGKDVDLNTIAHKLNVASVLEGSVRRFGHKIRVTAQLNNAVTGYHLWSQTYDRDLGDMLKLQTEIATSVAEALKVTLLGDVSQKIDVGGTRNSAAFDAYLRGLKLARMANSASGCDGPVRAFGEAIAADPGYALAYAGRSLVRWDCATYYTPDWLQQAVGSGVRADAARAIELAPGLAAAYIAMSNLEGGLLNFPAAERMCARALDLAPGSDQVLYYCSELWAPFGRADAAIALANRGVALDPLNPRSFQALGDALRLARRYHEAIVAYQRSIALDPEHADYSYAVLGVSHYLVGDIPAALTACKQSPKDARSLVCQAMVYAKLGRKQEAAAAKAALMALGGDGAAYQYAEIFTQWNDRRSALDWLEKAKRLGDPGLIYVRTDPLLDPLRGEPRFQAIEQALRLPT